MDFLSKIKNTISAQTIENLASFLGEEKNAVDTGLGLSLNSFLVGLLEGRESDSELKNTIKVLNDGGHTGDILGNLESFSTNFEKTQLLVTIGNNISAHFLGDKIPALVEKISDISNVRKTSASSLLSLSAPIVLGCVGKTMKDKNLDLAGLRSLFHDTREDSINKLPPTISDIFQPTKKTFITNEPIPTNTNTPKEKIKTENKSNWATILPWIILGIAGLSAIYYAKINDKDRASFQSEQAVISEKTQPDLRSEDFMPDSNVAALPIEKNVVPIQKQVESKLTLPPTETSSLQKLGKTDVETPRTIDENQEKTNTNPSQPKVEASKKTEIKETKTKNVKLEENKASESKTSENKQEKIKTPTGWNALNTNTFNQKSAEISSSSGLNSIVSQLKNSSKTIKISPLSGSNRTLNEDRAYGMREYLIEKGISEDQIIISSSIAGSNPNGIVYRIGN